MKQQCIKNNFKIWILVLVLVFETVFAGYVPAYAASVSDNTVNSEMKATEDLIENEKETEPFTGASGESGDLTWNITADGHLTITGTGNYETDRKGTPPWHEYSEYIKTAKVNISDITDISYMFYDCQKLTDVDLSNLNTSKVTDMRDIFGNCYSLTTVDLSDFNTQNVTSMSAMFWDCGSLQKLDLSSFDTRNVTDMTNMFWYCENITEIKINPEKFNTSNVTKMSRMFEGCKSLKSIDVTHFDTSKVTEMRFMFANCQSLTELHVTGFDTSNVKNFNYMFSDCCNLTELDVTNFDTTSAQDLTAMFYGCTKLKSIDLSSFTTSNVTQMPGLFLECSSLTHVNIAHFDTSKVKNINVMFSGCTFLRDLDLSMLDFSSVTSATNVIKENYELNRIVWPDMPIDITFDRTFYDENGTAFDMLPAHSGKVKLYSEAYTKTYCYINGHAFDSPVFTWNGTESATAYYKCIIDQCEIENEQTIDAVITSETIPATAESEGKIIYTASVVIQGKTYTDVKIVVIPKLEKKPENVQNNQEVQKTETSESELVSVGKKFKYSKAKYKVTKVTAAGGEVQYHSSDKKLKTVNIPAEIKINGMTYKVTTVAQNAFKNNKKLTKVIIGKNVTKIESKAFFGCKNLKKIVIKSKKLKSVGKNAIKGINKKAKIDVPKSKRKAYKKLFKTRTGFKKTMSIK